MTSELNQSIEIPELRAPFLFYRRPVSLPADLRPGWRIGLTVLLLKKCCRQGKSTLTRLHVLSWGFRSNEGRSQLLAAASGTLSPHSLIIRFEPFLLQAIDYAIAEHLVRRDKGSTISLSESGSRLAQELDDNSQVFASEKAVMEILRTRITEDLVKRMFGWKAAA